MRRPAGFDHRPSKPDHPVPPPASPAEELDVQATEAVPTGVVRAAARGSAEDDSSGWFRPKRRNRAEQAVRQQRSRDRERRASIWDRDHPANEDEAIRGWERSEPRSDIDPTSASSANEDTRQWVGRSSLRTSAEAASEGRGTFPADSPSIGSPTTPREREHRFPWQAETPVSESNRRVRAAKQQVRHMRRRAKRTERAQRRRFRAFRRRQLRPWIISGGVLLLLAVAVAAGVLTPLMSVRHIEIVGASTVDEVALQESLQPLKGEPIALITDDDVAQRLQPFERIQSYSVTKLPPDQLTVRIHERVPVLAIDAGGSFEQFDAAGVMLEETETAPEHLPVALGDVRNPGTESFHAAAEVLRSIPSSMRGEVREVDAPTPNEVTLFLTDGVEVMWGDVSESQFKTLVLERMRTALGDRPVTRIDVSSPRAPVFE